MPLHRARPAQTPERSPVRNYARETGCDAIRPYPSAQAGRQAGRQTGRRAPRRQGPWRRSAARGRRRGSGASSARRARAASRRSCARPSTNDSARTHARQRTRPSRVSCGWLPAISKSSAEAHKHVVGGGGAGVVARGGVVSHVRPDLSSASTMTTERAARALSEAKSKLVSAPAASEAEIAKQSLRAPHHRDQWQHAPIAALVSATPRARGARAPEGGGTRAYHGATRGARVLLARMLHPPQVTFSRPRGTRATNSSQR
jgi:hypothetical protein